MLQVVRKILDRIRCSSEPDRRTRSREPSEIFHRPHLASRMAADLLSRSHASGMFLTGPRRTGKSTFVKNDLCPALEREHQALILYVDLWERGDEDPGAVIVGLVREAVKTQERLVAKTMGRLSLSRLRIPGLELELKKTDEQRPPSLKQSLERLSDLSRRTVVLIIDEAQQTQTTAYGRNVLYMLKSARDQLNGRDRILFRLLATGSHKEKIERLVSDKHQAFYCAPLEVMPTLGGEDFLAWERTSHGPAFRPGLAAMAEAFDLCLRRPEVFRVCCRETAEMAHLPGPAQEQALLLAAQAAIETEKHKLEARVRLLDPLDQAVLRLMAEDGARFSPFFPPAERRLSAMLAAMPAAPVRDVSATAVRASLARLCEARLVWCGDGPHVLEESQFADWLVDLELAGPAVGQCHAIQEFAALR